MIKSGTILLIIVSVLLSLFAFMGCSASQSENNGSSQITQSSTEDATAETVREDIGQWIDEGWPGGAIITITRENESIILDIKTPGSGMDKKMDFNNIERLSEKDQLKFVIVKERSGF